MENLIDIKNIVEYIGYKYLKKNHNSERYIDNKYNISIYGNHARVISIGGLEGLAVAYNINTPLEKIKKLLDALKQ